MSMESGRHLPPPYDRTGKRRRILRGEYVSTTVRLEADLYRWLCETADTQGLALGIVLNDALHETMVARRQTDAPHP